MHWREREREGEREREMQQQQQQATQPQQVFRSSSGRPKNIPPVASLKSEPTSLLHSSAVSLPFSLSLSLSLSSPFFHEGKPNYLSSPQKWVSFNCSLCPLRGRRHKIRPLIFSVRPPNSAKRSTAEKRSERDNKVHLSPLKS